MTVPSWNVEKPSSTRDRIIRLLLKHQLTIEAMAEKLGITENAVRSQIALLQREGKVEIQGEIKGTRRPAALYGVVVGADVQLSKAYPVVLSHLVKVLTKRIPPKEFKTVMKDVGKDIADSLPPPVGTAQERIAETVNILKSLGSHADVTEEGGKFVITGHGCPISKAVTVDVRSCLAMESLLNRLTGLPVTEHCNHGERPSCRFEISLPAGKGKL
jgi:predicted ArsR family transcriptional regulator